MSEPFQEQLRALRARSLHRKLREIGSAQGPEVQIVGRQLINFSSDDYLGLAADPILRQAAMAAIEEFGVGEFWTWAPMTVKVPGAEVSTAI